MAILLFIITGCHMPYTCRFSLLSLVSRFSLFVWFCRLPPHALPLSVSCQNIIIINIIGLILLLYIGGLRLIFFSPWLFIAAYYIAYIYALKIFLSYCHIHIIRLLRCLLALVVITLRRWLLISLNNTPMKLLLLSRLMLVTVTPELRQAGAAIVCHAINAIANTDH
jgi:hypothetical protein